MRTEELLRRFLPAPPVTVIDAGGGPGAYTVLLQQRGDRVVLLDPIRLHTEQARASGARAALVGDARALPAPAACVDAVLLLGPLYHLIERDDRVTALREAARVTRSGGLVCAALISRFASTTSGLMAGFLDQEGFEEIVERDLTDGVHLNPTLRPGWFTTAYFHHPAEIDGEFGDAGLTVEATLAIDGLGGLVPDLAACLDDDVRRDTLLRALRRVEGEPSMLGASDHIWVAARVGPGHP